MEIRHNIVRMLAVAMLASGVVAGGCGNKVQRNPSLTKVPDVPEKPPEKGFLQKAGDTTWSVVSAPARWVAPKKRPAPEEPEVIDPPGLIIVGRGKMVTPPPTEPVSDAPPATAPSN